MRKGALLLVALLLGLGSAHAQTPQTPISGWPAPTSGSPYLSFGDAVTATRAGVTYKLFIGTGGGSGNCPSNQWVNAFSAQGVPSCAQPGFANLAGFVALSQISGTYTNGQLLIGNTGTGNVQAGNITAGLNTTVTNTAGSIAIAGSATPVLTSETINANAASLPTKQTGTLLQAGNANSTATRLEADAFAASSYFSAVREDGTAATPTTLQANDEIGGVNGWGYNSSAIVGPKVSFRMFASQNWTTGANGTYADIATTPTGSTTLTERFYVDPSGTVGIGTNVPAAQLDVRGLAAENGHISNGTTFSVTSGCGTVGSVTGGATTGSFTAGQAACVPILALPTAAHGWHCDGKDITAAHQVNFLQTGVGTTSCTLSATVTSGDTILIHAEGY